MARAFLVIASVFGFLGVAVGAFGSHALRRRLTPERLNQVEIGVRYQLWHALALFAVVFVGSFLPTRTGGWFGYAPLQVVTDRGLGLFPLLAGWLFAVGVILFSGSLYALALTGDRAWAAITPLGGVCLLAGWLSLFLAVVVA